MKKICRMMLFLCFASQVMAQNMSPVISNLSVNHMLSSNSVEFIFDVSDTEGDALDLQVRISADSGLTWLVQLDSLTGDTGYPQTPGNGKSIVWVYNINQLAADYGLAPVAFEARLVADDRQGVDIQALVDQVDSTRLVQTLQFVEGTRHRTTGVAHLQEVQDSLSNLVAGLQLQSRAHSWNYQGYQAWNYDGRLPGCLDEARTWYVTGHYDSVFNTPGADDNGTGTAAVMEIARILSAYRYENSLRFIGFDLEESGLLGAKEYVNNQVPAWEDLAGVLNMEMIGYKDTNVNTQTLPFGFNILFPAAYAAVEADSFRGNFMTNVANTASTDLRQSFDACAAAYVPGLRVVSLEVAGTGTIAPDLRRSDHAAFWDGGYQALMLTDGGDSRNVNYHSAADSIGTLDLGFYVQNVKAVLATAAKIAKPIHADAVLSDSFLLDLSVGLDIPIPTFSWSVFPNPSRQDFKIKLWFPEPCFSKIEIWSLDGRKVKDVWSANLEAGKTVLSWNGKNNLGTDVPTGNYLLKLMGDGFEESKQISLTR